MGKSVITKRKQRGAICVVCQENIFTCERLGKTDDEIIKELEADGGTYNPNFETIWDIE